MLGDNFYLGYSVLIAVPIILGFKILIRKYNEKNI